MNIAFVYCLHAHDCFTPLYVRAEDENIDDGDTPAMNAMTRLGDESEIAMREVCAIARPAAIMAYDIRHNEDTMPTIKACLMNSA